MEHASVVDAARSGIGSRGAGTTRARSAACGAGIAGGAAGAARLLGAGRPAHQCRVPHSGLDAACEHHDAGARHRDTSGGRSQVSCSAAGHHGGRGTCGCTGSGSEEATRGTTCPPQAGPRDAAGRTISPRADIPRGIGTAGRGAGMILPMAAGGGYSV